ncbi:MAG: penicillin-binding protein 2 [Actinomycetes bacterium]
MSESSRRRLTVLQVLVVSLVVTLLGRLWFLQVVAGPAYRSMAAQMSVTTVASPAVRGLILDDQGRPLAQNRTTLVVSVSRTVLLAQPDQGAAVLARTADLLGMTRVEAVARTTLCGTPGAVVGVCWNGSPYQLIPLTVRADQPAALAIMERQDEFPGVTAEVQAVRQYPRAYGANAAHVLGYLGPVSPADLAAQAAGAPGHLVAGELVGRSGLEQAYDTYLRGTPGVTRLAVDSRGQVVRTVTQALSVPGNYVVTSIDARVQAVAEAQLQAALERARSLPNTTGGPGSTYVAPAGAVVVLDATNGRVVAMASAPSYDPNVWVGGISQAQYDRLMAPSAHLPLLDRAIAGQFPTGSIFKVVTTSAAAQAGFDLGGSYDCPPSITVGGRQFGNFHGEAFGRISLEQAIQVSCDTVFYNIAYEMWKQAGGLSGTDAKDPLVRMSQGYGLGRPTGIDLPGEAAGRVPSRAWLASYYASMKGYYCTLGKAPGAGFVHQFAREFCADGNLYLPGDELNLAIGQGDMLATPLQMARVYAAIANGGTLYAPQVATAVISPTGTVVTRFAPKIDGHLPVSPATLAYLQRVLPTVSASPLGTGHQPFVGFPLGQIPVASKTGTAEVAGKQTQSWFATYAPAAGSPRYAVVMTIEQGGTGSLTAGPSVRAIYEALFGVRGGTVDPAAAILPGALPPVGLPVVGADGRIHPPGTVLPRAVRTRSSSSPAMLARREVRT